MAKLVLISVLIALITLPTLAARDKVPRRGMKRAVLAILLFNLFYAVAALFIWPFTA